MKRPAIFFDRDNTLIVSDGYLGDPTGVRLIPGAADAIARARQLGYATVVVSNQSGVARGMFTETAVRNVNARLDDLLKKQNQAAVIDRHEFCPYHPDGLVERYRIDSDLRKPKPGMIIQAAEALALDLSRSWVIGDAPRDIEAGHAAGCRTILFSDPSLPRSPAAAEKSPVEPEHTCSTLAQALDYIQQHPPPTSEEKPAGTDPIPMPSSAAEPATPPSEGRTDPSPLARIEAQLERIAQELRRSGDTKQDFSVSKLLAGIVQVVVLAVLFVAYLNRGEPTALLNVLVLGLLLQTLTIALLIMSRQR
jgi:D-glycero-D-manno-heptose 1,7-bisphosphate phosphatase